MSPLVAAAIMLVCFIVLTKCADWFVDGAVGIAEHLKVPKMLIGLVLVSLATTSPELAVSVQSALSGHAEIALGNAVGSVIVDDGVALGLGALVTVQPLTVNRFVLKTTGVFLIAVGLLAYALAFDGTLGRPGGLILVSLFVAYTIFAYKTRKHSEDPIASEELEEIEEAVAGKSVSVLVLWFGIGLGGVLIASHWIVESAVVLAAYVGVSEALVGLTVIAIGTSLPEIATCVTAARKGHGGIVIGNILGADILNICWIAGASAIVNPLTVSARVIHFSFPAMMVIMLVRQTMMWLRGCLNRGEGLVLIALYVVYLGMTAKLFL